MSQESNDDGDDEATTHEPNSDGGATDSDGTNHETTDADATSDDATDAEQAAKAAEAIAEIGVERLTEEIVGAWQAAGMEPFDAEEDSTDRDDD
ncbi:hypothetical protein [Halorussus pelagicus]|uniref:hypothetical protein n=1 Tax=Halorussus pelagicus TaxID=2505977 RepID=UPI000FFC0C2B|nr:hypothetical protein [Halorussus pelagicus]